MQSNSILEYISTEIIGKLGTYLSYSFVQYALIVGVLVAFASALLGVVLVLKRYSYIGDGLSHVAFGAMAIATVLRFANQTTLVLPITMFFAVLLIRRGRNAKMQGDAALAMLSVSALAIGYTLFNRFPPKGGNVSADVCSTLFGSTSILTLTPDKVWLSALLALSVVLLFVVFYHRIFSVTFDEDFSQASGFRVSLYQLILAFVIATVVVLAMSLVGSLLITALIIFPALASMRLFRSFKAVVLSSCILSVLNSLFGILISILLSTPVGATIVLANLASLILFSLIDLIRRRA